MLCKQRFKVSGLLRLEQVRPIRTRSDTWEFEVANGLVTHICVTVRVLEREFWPRITPNPAPGVSFALSAVPPHTMFVQIELKTLQGLLSLFGLRSIDIPYPEIEWTPENDEEREYLKVYSFKSKRQEPRPESISALSFDVVARAVLACRKAYQIEMPLSFFRRAVVDMDEHQFIEAIYDLYFVLETMYGDGKFKKAAILARFKASDELRQATETTLRDPDDMPKCERRIKQAFRDKFSGLTVDQYLEHVVDLRGFLHHHTQRRKENWDPEDQSRYEVDAVVLQRVVFNAIFHVAWAYLEDPAVLSQYKDQFLRKPE